MYRIIERPTKELEGLSDEGDLVVEPVACSFDADPALIAELLIPREVERRLQQADGTRRRLVLQSVDADLRNTALIFLQRHGLDPQ